MKAKLGPFNINCVTQGDSSTLVDLLPDDSIDVIVTSPPYWGQRLSGGSGSEEDPRDYLSFLVELFAKLLPKLKTHGIMWINLGDAYNTPVNWRKDDHQYSSLGADKTGLNENNSAYVKPRAKRRAFVDESDKWLRYGNLLNLPHRLIMELSSAGFLFRGEIIWKKRNPMPEGRCRRPHRQHEPIFLLSKTEEHSFRVAPPVGSVWEIANEKIEGLPHYSRFPEELPRRCIEAYGRVGPTITVLDPFSGSGTTGLAARKLHCAYIGFEIDPEQAKASNERIAAIEYTDEPLFRAAGIFANAE